MHDAMNHSLAAVVESIGQEEAPIFDEIRSIGQRPAAVDWEANVEKLQTSLGTNGLKTFANQFFGSVGVGLGAGIAAGAAEVLVGELVLGPVGLVAGLATFVAVGVKPADWNEVKGNVLRAAEGRELELVTNAREALNFPALVERRKRRILELIDALLQALAEEQAQLTSVSNEFAACALGLSEVNLPRRRSSHDQ